MLMRTLPMNPLPLKWDSPMWKVGQQVRFVVRVSGGIYRRMTGRIVSRSPLTRTLDIMDSRQHMWTVHYDV